MSVEDIKREVEEVWQETPATRLSLQIIDYMLAIPDQELRMLTVPSLLAATGHDEPDTDFFVALAILSSSRIHLLDAKAFYCEKNGEEVHLDARQLSDARRTGTLENPETGELIDDYESRLIPYFESSEVFLRARKDD